MTIVMLSYDIPLANFLGWTSWMIAERMLVADPLHLWMTEDNMLEELDDLVAELHLEGAAAASHLERAEIFEDLANLHGFGEAYMKSGGVISEDGVTAVLRVARRI